MYSTVVLPAPQAISPSSAQSSCSRGGRQLAQLSLPLRIPLLQLDNIPQRSSINEAALALSSPQTPPGDEMGTTYQPPNVAAYENHHPHHHHHHGSLSGYASALAQADRKRTSLRDAQAALTNYARIPTQSHLHHSQTQPHARHVLPSSVSSQPSQPPSAYSTRSSTPTSNAVMPSSSLSDAASRRDSVLVMHSLEIPICISPSGGNLADFAAQLTCLFWFESPQVHQTAEKIEVISSAQRTPRLHPNAIPQPNFKRWVHSVLSTTQVAQNVIILALLFIYRLKVTNPQVKGRPGSEYRLLTVALMLGNKFLDDNTYTNKTWAEVSGISVKEIHVMEVEFLSNMRYSLLVSKDGWGAWLVKLAKFWEYCERAMMPPASPLVIPSPSHPGFVSPLPSPTGTLQLTPNVHSTPAAYSPRSSAHATNGQTWSTTYQGPSAVSPLATKLDIKKGLGKRLHLDEDLTEPPAKRSARTPHNHRPVPSQSLAQSQPGAAAVPEPLRLPAPHLTLNTAPYTQPPQANPTPFSATAYAPQTQSALSLPPLVPGVRAMATVYPPPTATTFATQLPILATSAPALTSSSTAAAVAATPTGYAATGYGTPTKRHSPVNVLTPVAAAYASSSPMTESFPHISGVHTPISHSPSIYLQQRASPYKPIRNFNTLLYPPPSASLQEYHLSGTVVPPNQMYYQPLGRRNEFRTGIVPEFQTVPYGGAVRHGLSLTPVQMPTTHGPAHNLQAPNFPN